MISTLKLFNKNKKKMVKFFGNKINLSNTDVNNIDVLYFVYKFKCVLIYIRRIKE